MLYLSDADVQRLVPMDTCIGLMEELFVQDERGLVENRPRQHLVLPGGGFHRTIIGGAYGFNAFGLKSYAATSPPPRYMVLLYNATTGALEAIVDAKYLGQLRTGAVAAVATRRMARPDSSTIGIIGTGREARSQLEAMTYVMSIRSVRCYSRTEERRNGFAKEMSEKFKLEVTPVTTGEDCVKGVDVVITITNSSTPVLQGDWLEPGMHLNAVGATSSVYRREIDEVAVKRAGTVVVEDLDQVKSEAGELIHAVQRGLLRWSKVLELRQVVSGKAAGRQSADEITLFKSLGVASEDMAGAAYALQKAREQGIGIELPIPER